MRWMPTLLGATLAALACGDVPHAPGSVPPGEPAPASLDLSPGSQTLIEGDAVMLTAVVLDSAGTVLADAAVAWSALPEHVVAVTPDGTVRGRSLGNGLVIARAGDAADTVAIRVRLRFQALSAGAGHTCGVTTAGSAYCWGWNQEGRLGNGSIAPVAAPARVVAQSSFLHLSAGWEITCGVVGGGAACWGSNRSGQLGSESKSDALSPAWVTEPARFVAVATQATHSCAITELGQDAWCWGAGWTGQRGMGDRSAGPPVPVTGDLRFGVVDVGWLFTCGITLDGAAWCWGTNRDGQLGTADGREPCPWTDGSWHPCAVTPVPVASALVFDTLAAGTNHACALTADGAAHCWGRNDVGQLGVGSTVTGFTPQPVPAPLPFMMVTAGDRHTCALATDGTAWCWGDNGRGTLGTGAATGDCAGAPCALLPTPVSTTLRFRWLTAARGETGAHTCGLATDGLAYCWGDNLRGQLGTGRVDGGGWAPRVVAGQRVGD
jgi:alpha-tubulin suppressor-like RCC1 family protein